MALPLPDRPRSSSAWSCGRKRDRQRDAARDRRPSSSRLTIAEPARIYRRGRTPIYPYYYNPGRPGGYSFYFGFVPYAPGNIENQALQRQFYPQDTEWPPGLYGGPRPGWGPKRWD